MTYHGREIECYKGHYVVKEDNNVIAICDSVQDARETIDEMEEE